MSQDLLIGLSALGAQQRAIEVASHNISNAATPGYTRQRAELVAQTPQNIRPGQLGRGVQVDAIRRLSEDLLTERLRRGESETGRVAAVAKTLKNIELFFNEPGENGLAQATNQLFAVFEDVANNPESSALRATAVQQLRSFSEGIAALGNQLSDARDDLRSAIAGELEQVNDIAAEVAALNQSIRSQTVLGNQANDLLDRRDRLLRELSNHVAVRVRIDARDNAAMVDINGHQLVGPDRADRLRIGDTTADGTFGIIGEAGTGVRATGGSLAGLLELHRDILPGIQARMDTFATTTALELNARHATGTSQAGRAVSFTGTAGIAATLTALNLDDPAMARPIGDDTGIPAAFLPDFTDATGNAEARNLTINVLDPTTGTARKYTLRYDPNTGSGTRSLDDLVQAVNTGRGGGFTLYPPRDGGIDGVTARKVQFENGLRLQLDASGGRTIDFSAALDQRPSATAWTGPTATVSGSEPTWADQRLLFRVSGAGVEVSLRDPINGNRVPVQTIALPGTSGPAVVAAVGALTVTLPAGSYRSGDAFAVELDGNGGIRTQGPVTGQHAEAATWSAGDAAVTFRGRYTGELGFTPGQPWSMSVLTSGTIGAKSGSSSTPPTVEFTYYTGTREAPVQQRLRVTLDERFPAGTPVAIADGVYAEFGAGVLTANAGNRLDVTIDARPDEARLLPALGINGLLTGDRAATLAVDARLITDPTQLAVGTTRAAGDNSNLLRFAGMRQEKLFDNGGFALDDYYQTTVSEIGVRIQQAERQGESQSVLSRSLENQRDQISGVSIDEEIGNLVLLQQAYQAAARVVSQARENMQALLGILQ
jgi:flagellar hook-associated protein 1 FlgK